MMIILAIGAHPDDETMFAGGLLAKYASEGHDVYILLTTRGEGGEAGGLTVAGPTELGQLREAEARAAADALRARDVMFLPFVDPSIGPDGEVHAIAATADEFSMAIATVIGTILPDVVITHGSGGEYGHPQHKFTHSAVFAALARLQPWQPTEVLTWCAAYPDPERPRFMNQDDPADMVLDITPWYAQKVAAATAYRSQHELFLRNADGKPLEQIPLRIESYHRQDRRRTAQDSAPQPVLATTPTP